MIDTINDLQTTSALATRQLSDFFTRLAEGDYHNLAKELDISGKPTTPILSPFQRTVHALEEDDDSDPSAPDTSIRSIDSVESFKFRPTAAGLHRAVSLLRDGDEARRGRPPTPEEEEAFQFTFRLMIHKLYSIGDFARMVADVVRTSQEHFRPLEPAHIARGRRRASLSFSFASHGDADADSVASMSMSGSEVLFPSLRSPLSDASSLLPPSSPASSAWAPLSPTVDYSYSKDDAEVRAVKKRIVGRKLSVVDKADGDDPEEQRGGTPTWVYDAAVASVDSPAAHSYFDEPFLPTVTSSPSRGGYAEDGGDGVSSRKRRFSFLARRGL